MVVAIVLLMVAIGSIVFHLLSPWWWTPIASNWRYIDDTIVLTFWITGVVFVAVIVFMAYCVMRFRHVEGRRSQYLPENSKLEWTLTGLTTFGVVGMLAPGLIVWHDYVTVPKDATSVEVVAQQWQWSYRLPGKDGKLGTSDARHVSEANPLGLNPNDPNGRDDIIVVAGELHLPIDRPVKMTLRALDVLHNFYVPQFRAKMDMVPGMVTYFWFRPTRTGSFQVLCAELCGVGHHQMRGTVVVDTAADYQSWLTGQSTFQQLRTAATMRRRRASGTTNITTVRQ